jgi:tetratricopeptide (TPR) repeat protein
MIARVGARALVSVAILALALPARAAPSEAEAANLFSRGRAEYERADYDRAYNDFKQAYLLSARPALIYNMARALEGLKRYAEAAGALRAYLRVSQSDPDQAQIEEHIRALDEAQRLQSSGALALTPGPLRDQPPPPRRKRTLVIALSVAAVVVAALAVGLGVGLGTRGPVYSSADVGPLKSTP